MKNMTAQEYADEQKLPYAIAMNFLKVLANTGLIKTVPAPKVEVVEGTAKVDGIRGRKAEVYAIPDTVKVNMFGVKSIETKVRPSKEERAATEAAKKAEKDRNAKVKAEAALVKAEKAAAEKIAKAKAKLDKANAAEAAPAEAVAAES